MDSRERLAMTLAGGSKRWDNMAAISKARSSCYAQADAIQSQAAEVARLRGALGKIERMEDCVTDPQPEASAMADLARAALAQRGGDDGQG